MKKIKPITNSFFNKSMAFLEVAIISTKTNDANYFNTSEYMNVTSHLVYHATELFLKGGICTATRDLPPTGHDIFSLHSEYKKLYSNESLNFILPFQESTKYLGFTESQKTQREKDYPMDLFLQLRYPMGSIGELYKPITKYDTEYLKRYKKELMKVYTIILATL